MTNYQNKGGSVMNQKKDIYLQIKGEIATIFINRPEKRNAFTFEMWKELPDLIDECEQNPSVKVIIFSGVDGITFSAGADISEFTTLRSTVEGASKYNDVVLKAEKAIIEVSKPTIAMIQGYCVGGGCEIAVACDFRFADENGKFGVTPAKLGIVYNTRGTKNIVDLVGPSKAKDILYTGRLIGAEEALEIGLIDRIIPSDSIENETRKYASTICRNAQLTVRGAKKIITQVLEGAVNDTPEANEMIVESFTSEDYKEGINAFLEKRRPNFKYS